MGKALQCARMAGGEVQPLGEVQRIAFSPRLWQPHCGPLRIASGSVEVSAFSVAVEQMEAKGKPPPC